MDFRCVQPRPKLIIFDVFHRCGATRWSQRAKRLFKVVSRYEDSALSATNIRDLGNERYMAELLDGYIAS
nr:hypothetical protein [uncultured Dysosmobacter sp.]